MSMISAQIDELRRYADMEDCTFPLLASALRDAADTIWELRGALQVASVDYRHLSEENAKLRELLADTLMQPRDYCKKYGVEYESWDSANDHLDARMRALGVDVP